MSTIMTRDGAKSWWGVDLPRHVAYLYQDEGHFFPDSGKPIWKEMTYAEIFARKKEIQDRCISAKRQCDMIVPGLIWVFYNDSWLFGGWYVYVRTTRKDYAMNFRDAHTGLRIMPIIRQILPCGVLPLDKSFNEWCRQFEKLYHRPGKRKLNAVKTCWCKIDWRNELMDVKLSKNELD